MPKKCGGVGGSQYRDAFEEFANAAWSSITRILADQAHGTQVTSFRLAVAPAPCGPSGCTAMPRCAFVPSSTPSAPRRRSSSISCPATTTTRVDGTYEKSGQLSVQGRGPTTSPPTPRRLNSFVADVPKIARPTTTCRLPLQSRVFLPTAQRWASGGREMSADDALKRLAADVDEQVKRQAIGRLAAAPRGAGRDALAPCAKTHARPGSSWAQPRHLRRLHVSAIVINLHYAFTAACSCTARPALRWLRESATLLDCGSYFDPSSCRKDIFWRAVWNTARFSVFQVSLWCCQPGHRAVLNRKIIGRGFWPACTSTVLLSPWCGADLEVGPAARGPAQRRMSRRANPCCGWPNRWAFFWVIFVSIWPTWLLHADPAGRAAAIPADLYEAAQMDARRPGARSTASRCAAAAQSAGGAGAGRDPPVQIFDEVFVLTGGGPARHHFVVQFIYQTGFQEQVRLYGLAAADRCCWRSRWSC